MVPKNRSLFLNYFKPSIYIQNVNKINLVSLYNHGIRVMLCDLDNTLVPFFVRIPNKEILMFINAVKKAGIKFVLISNNIKKRVELFAQKAGIEEYYWNAKKPMLKTFREIKRKHNVNNNEMIIVGDQLITDVLYANRAHIESILVAPAVVESDSWKVINFLEKYIYKKLAQENILYQGFYDEGEMGIDYELL